MGAIYTAHKHRKLWLANYQVTKPMLPIGGGWTDWWLWQFTDRGRHPGYPSQLDTNRFAGTTEAYLKWVGKTVVSPLTVEERLERLEKKVFG